MSYFDFSPVATSRSVVIEQIWKPETKSWAFETSCVTNSEDHTVTTGFFSGISSLDRMGRFQNNAPSRQPFQ